MATRKRQYTYDVGARPQGTLKEAEEFIRDAIHSHLVAHGLDEIYRDDGTVYAVEIRITTPELIRLRWCPKCRRKYHYAAEHNCY